MGYVELDVLQKVISGSDLNQSCHQLVVLLRDDDYRNSEPVRDAIPQICARVVSTLNERPNDPELLKLMIKVLVNALANANRDLFILQGEQFWKAMISLIGEQYFAELFLLQFYRETDKSLEYSTTLNANGITNKINHLFLQLSHDIDVDISYALEILTEYRVNSLTIDVDDESLVSYLWVLQNGDLEEEEREDLAKVIEYVTREEVSLQYHHDQFGFTSLAIVLLLDQLEAERTSSNSNLRISRHLFASVGNISSTATFDNWQCVAKCIDILNKNTLQEKSQYATTAAQVVLGNSITSQETKNKMLEVLGKDLIGDIVKLIIWPPKTDVIQYQGVFHLLRHLMSPSIAEQTFKYGEGYAACCKVVIDNKTYYAEIHTLMIKCTEKLFTEYKGVLLDQYGPIFEVIKLEPSLLGGIIGQKVLIEANDDKTILENQPEHIRDIISAVVSQNEVELHVLLEKLKTMAILFTKFTYHQIEKVYQERNIDQEFLQPYTEYFNKLRETISSRSTSNLPEIIINNSAYIGAVGTAFFKDSVGPEGAKMMEMCEKLTALSRQ